MTPAAADGDSGPEDLPALCRRYVDALMAGDTVRARWLVDDALEHGVAVRDVYLHVLAPAMVEIGHLWAQDRINVAREHHATATTEGILAALGARMRAAPSGGRLTVVACTPGELHCLGARMVADFLEAAGWEVIHLGGSTPADDLAEMVAEERPDAVVLSTTTPGRLPGAEEALAHLAPLRPGPLLVVGGQAWRRTRPEWVVEAGADVRLEDVDTLLAVLDRRFPAPVED